MDNKYLVSIIVPVYNVEKYLRRCVNSIISQTYQNLEIILVDDGSLDSSSTMCDEFEKEDNRIKVIHQNNKGLSGARNTGLSLVTGEYVAFVDSDDWIDKDTIKYCMSLISRYNNKPDVVQFGIMNVYGLDDKLPKVKEKIEKYSGKDILQNYMERITKTDSYCAVWRCVYLSTLVCNEKFREGKINEDIDYKYRVLRKANMLINSNVKKYYYFQGIGSLTTAGLKRRDFDLYDAANELVKLTVDEEYGSIYKIANVKKARTSLSLLCKIAYYGVSDESIEKEKIVLVLQTRLRRDLGIILFSSIPISRKLLAIMFSINFKITKQMINILRRLSL